VLQQTRTCAEVLNVDVNKVEAKPPAGARVPQKRGRPRKPEGGGQPHRSGQALQPGVVKRAPPPLTGEGGVSPKLNAGPPRATRPHPVDVNQALGVPGQSDLLQLGPGGNPVTTDRHPPRGQLSGEA